MVFIVKRRTKPPLSPPAHKDGGTPGRAGGGERQGPKKKREKTYNKNTTNNLLTSLPKDRLPPACARSLSIELSPRLGGSEVRTWVLPRGGFSSTFRQLYVRKKCGRSEETLRKKFVRSAEEVRNRCGRSAEEVRNRCGRSSEEVRNHCGSGAEEEGRQRAMKRGAFSGYWPTTARARCAGT